MNNRIIDLSEHPADLSIKHRQLVIRSNGQETTVPLEDIAAVIISHPAVRLTHAAISELCGQNAGLVVCDERHMPAGMILPMSANYIQTERMTAQADMSTPAKKILWRAVVKAKIRAQGNTLKHFYEDDGGLCNLAKKVRSGDPDNIEARASRIYWPKLLGDRFRREPQGDDQINSFLNYGYAVIRAMMARAICAGGLNPTLGLHHRNRYNPFCLADDLMEPYRPIVDAVAADLIGKGETERIKLDREGKQKLISSLIHFRCGGREGTSDLFFTFTRVVSSLVEAIAGKRRNLFLPVPFE